MESSRPGAKSAMSVMERALSEKNKTSDEIFQLETELDWIAQEEKSIKHELRIKALKSYTGLEAALNRLCSLGIYDYFKASHIDVAKGRTYDLDDLKERLTLLDKFEKFYKFMVNVLREDGFIGVQDNRVQFLKEEVELGDPKKLTEELETSYPEFRGLLRILRHCIEHYSLALTGEIAAISVLYPDGTPRFLDDSSKDSAEYKQIRVYELLLKEVVHKIASKSRANRLRILEVGAGRGILTRLIAHQLKDQSVEYHFTDIGKSFVIQARKEFQDPRFEFMKFGLLDISKDTRKQGYEPSSFDIILGLNVVHATPCIEETLRNLKNLLTPSGVLLLVEAIKPYRWDNLIWGLAEGWWYFNDTDLRTDSPLISLEKWEWVLRKSGFTAIQVYPQDNDERPLADSGLMIAQRHTRATAGHRSGAGLPAIHRGGLVQKTADSRQEGLRIERTTYPMDKCIHELFEEQVKRTPDARALVFNGHELTYRELNERANQLGHRLRSLGVGPNTLVAISLDPSIEMIVGIYGILKAGGAYVPLDPIYPQDRLNYMLEGAKAPVLITQACIAQRWQLPNTEVLCLDTGWAEIARNSDQNPVPLCGLRDLIYVIYTSGSTGQPKGAGVYHGGFLNLLHWFTKTFEITEKDRALLMSSLSFDLTQKNLYATLIRGGELHLPPGARYDPGQIAQIISEQRVTLVNCTPSAFYPLVEHGGAPGHERLSSLRVALLGGEPIPIPRLRQWLESDACHCEMANTYGPTECTDICAFYRMNRQSMNAYSFVPIGRPIFNTKLVVLDDELRICPPGIPGELCVAGEGVGAGYINDPELTAAKFIPNPFSELSGERIYQTGDLVRCLVDGNIEFMGRKDHQIKLRGFRIELPEIEKILSGHASIREAVVVVWPLGPSANGAEDQRLVAYFVARSSPAPEPAELQAYLRSRLPEYMVPTVIVPLDRMPLSPNGKVDRRALPSPTRQRPALAQPCVAPRNELERWLAGMWREMLNLDSVGIQDRFFELGGNSLQAAVFINKIQQELGEWVYVVALFDAPSIAEFGAFLRANYPKALARRFPTEVSDAGVETQPIIKGTRKIDGAMIARMQECVPKLEPRELQGETPLKCERAIFVLAPPRSGTTLLRVMLAGHPDLFAAPELQLLGFHTLQERKAALSGKFAIWLEGVLRVIVELKGCDPEEAKHIMEEYERQELTTKRFYGLIQNWIAPRILVDKTPAYALDIAAMRKAEHDFAGALYIHLVRHPYAAIRSFESYHMDQVQFLRDHDFSPRDLGELVWTVSHQNILEFLEAVSLTRQYRMRFEDLTREPRIVMEGMCERFGLKFHPDLLEPYKNKERKMTDGLYDASTPMGDRKFLAYGAIDPKVADTWRTVAADDFLGDVTWDVAGRLGYEKPEVPKDGARNAVIASRQASERKNYMERQRQIRKRRRESYPERVD